MTFSDNDWHAAFESVPPVVDLVQIAEWRSELARLAAGLASRAMPENG